MHNCVHNHVNILYRSECMAIMYLACQCELHSTLGVSSLGLNNRFRNSVNMILSRAEGLDIYYPLIVSFQLRLGEGGGEVKGGWGHHDRYRAEDIPSPIFQSQKGQNKFEKRSKY